MNLSFTKMHGLGNDFMVVDCVTQTPTLGAAQITAWADRRTGIGFDQLLVLEPPTEPDADFVYRIFNADGSEAEQCGNGARCIMRFAVESGLTKRSRLVLQTSNNTITVQQLDAEHVSVDMGQPLTDAVKVPYAAPNLGTPEAPAINVDHNGEPLKLIPISMGNPHGVLFVRDVTATPVERLGAALTQHPVFPEGANIGFCEVVDRNFIRLRVFERGVGETRACGTGACAAMAAGRLQEKLAPRVKVSLPGGKVKIHWEGPGETLTMTGPATCVYTGQLQL